MTEMLFHWELYCHEGEVSINIHNIFPVTIWLTFNKQSTGLLLLTMPRADWLKQKEEDDSKVIKTSKETSQLMIF